MNESYLSIDNEIMFYRHNDLCSGRPLLLFVHGLGDSGLSYEDVFSYARLADQYNIVVPDLIGYGRSSQASAPERYSFAAHIERLWRLIEQLEADNIILLGHSMGGDITTLMCRENRGGAIKKYINMEGDVTQHELFISSKAVDAERRGRFDKWFEDVLKYRTMFRKLGHLRSSRLYFASLNFCRKEAFVRNARELVDLNTCLDGEFTSKIGEIYCQLDITRIFCYGGQSCSEETLSFLKQRKMKVKGFAEAGHSVMVDASADFYHFVADFIKQ
jgi:pimeloyl-ACP methyl ester carboxylesterase